MLLCLKRWFSGTFAAYLVVGVLNFTFWWYTASSKHKNCSIVSDCSLVDPPRVHHHDGDVSDLGRTFTCSSSLKLHEIHNFDSAVLEVVPSQVVEAYKEQQIAALNLPEHALVLNMNSRLEKSCKGFVHTHASQKWSDDTCLAVVSVGDLPHTPPILRWKGFRKKKRDKMKHAPGFQAQLPRPEDRLLLGQKMTQLLSNLNSIEKNIHQKLQVLKKHGNENNKDKDVVVMTLNDGEMDMLVNFACSCHHHGIDTSNVVVFAASPHIVDSINALGFIAIYDETYSSVSSLASAQYLDPIFVDMMWYKSFSVWILLRMGLNVLFQDVDLVWFQEPWTYLHADKRQFLRNRTHTDGFFSDDGQRGMRYAPFYANSGLYYLKANERTEYFAWSVLSAYDSVRLTGSHQNAFIARLIEVVDLAGLAPYLLDIDDFPTGVKYHRDRPYMKGIAEGWQHPFNFHMCWTLNKKNKIDYFQNVRMWYINGNSTNVDGDGGGNSDQGDACALAASYRAPHGSLYQYIVKEKKQKQKQKQKQIKGGQKDMGLLDKCCRAP
eukprot:GSChrysophyteH1.ASY1.ANO1.2796.1 assembled CDS